MRETAASGSLEAYNKCVLTEYNTYRQVKSDFLLEEFVENASTDSVDEVDCQVFLGVYSKQGEDVRVKVLVDDVLTREGCWHEVEVVDFRGGLELSLL